MAKKLNVWGAEDLSNDPQYWLTEADREAAESMRLSAEGASLAREAEGWIAMLRGEDLDPADFPDIKEIEQAADDKMAEAHQAGRRCIQARRYAKTLYAKRKKRKAA